MYMYIHLQATNKKHRRYFFLFHSLFFCGLLFTLSFVVVDSTEIQHMCLLLKNKYLFSFSSSSSFS